MTSITEKTTVTVGVLALLFGAYAWLSSRFMSMEIRQIGTDAKVEAILQQQRSAWTRHDMALLWEMTSRMNPTLNLPKIERPQ